MTPPTQPVAAGPEIRTHGPDEARRILVPHLRDLYADVYAEPPYNEGPDDVADFVQHFERRLDAPAFRLVTAWLDGILAGAVFGHGLRPDTRWWTGLLTPAPPDVTTEWAGRTVAIIELMVRGRFRRRGIGGHLLDTFLSAGTEKRAALLVRPEPEARPAQALYAVRGWRNVGRIRPFDGAPTYDAMLLDLRRTETDH